MGNQISNLASENINQTQLSSITQVCNQTFTAKVQDVTITAIDSHVGNIDISATLNVGSIDCVMSSVIDQSAIAAVTNTDLNQIAALPFQANINDISNTDITNIQSFQQAIINQSCNQSAIAEVTEATLTFIDSSTGNITIAATSSIENFSCNLQASSYQSASATVQDLSSNKISVGCCGFDLGMLIPVLFGLIALVVISKMATKQQSGQQGETQADQIARLVTAVNGSSGPRTSAMTAGTAVRV